MSLLQLWKDNVQCCDVHLSFEYLAQWISISLLKLEAHHWVRWVYNPCPFLTNKLWGTVQHLNMPKAEGQCYYSWTSKNSRIHLTACPDSHWMWCSKLLSQEQFRWWTLCKWRSRKFSQRGQVQRNIHIVALPQILLYHFTQFEWRWGSLYELSSDRDGGNGLLYSQVRKDEEKAGKMYQGFFLIKFLWHKEKTYSYS